MKKKIPSFVLYMFVGLFRLVILFVGHTSKVNVFNLESVKELRRKGQPVIFAFWHENLVLPPFLYYTSVGGERLVSLVSRSRDGEIIARILERFKGVTVRGSSSRGGAVALKEMAKKMIEEGWDAGMIPDGPKGPPFSIQKGVLKLSQLSGAPIIPCGIEVKRKIRLNSWDRLKVPFPFNRIALSFGEPIYVPSGERDLEPYKNYFWQEMVKTSAEAKKFVCGE